MIYNKFDRTFRVYAFKSVVITAGTLNTPKILMASGIGPANQLISLKVFMIMYFYKFRLQIILLFIDSGDC